MQLIQLVLQLQLLSLAVPWAPVQEAACPVPGLLPASRGVLPARLQHICHIPKELFFQALHALLHLAHATRDCQEGDKGPQLLESLLQTEVWGSFHQPTRLTTYASHGVDVVSALLQT